MSPRATATQLLNPSRHGDQASYIFIFKDSWLSLGFFHFVLFFLEGSGILLILFNFLIFFLSFKAENQILALF